MDTRRLQELLKAREVAALEAELTDAALPELVAVWMQLGALDKLVAFKLLDAPRAMELYALLPYREKYYLFCGFPLQSIAPVLEALAPRERRCFVQLPREFYDTMFRQLVGERVEAALTPRGR